MTTSAPQWPGQEDSQERGPVRSPRALGLQVSPGLRVVPDGVPPRPAPVPGPSALPGLPGRAGVRRGRGTSARRGRFVVVRDPVERDLWEKRRCARPGLPSPAAVTRDIALALLEVEAGCRSAAQLERIFSPELWQALEHRIGRRGGPLPSGRSLISVHCQEDRPGLADTVAVVQLYHVRSLGLPPRLPPSEPSKKLRAPIARRSPRIARVERVSRYAPSLSSSEEER